MIIMLIKKLSTNSKETVKLKDRLCLNNFLKDIKDKT